MTDAGLFAYESGCGMITFGIGGVTVGSIDATAVPSDGKLYANELAGQERSETKAISVMSMILSSLIPAKQNWSFATLRSSGISKRSWDCHSGSIPN